MAREKTEDIGRLIELLEDPSTSEYNALMYVKQAVIILLKEVKGLKEK